MGNTCSSVHIALTGEKPDVIEDCPCLCHARLRTDEDGVARRRQTCDPASQRNDPFLSVYDIDNAALDTGELKDLALATSKIFKTAAVCTSLYDSDTFEVVVFKAGKQVDIIMTDVEQYNGPLRVLSDASRAAHWS